MYTTDLCQSHDMSSIAEKRLYIIKKYTKALGVPRLDMSKCGVYLLDIQTERKDVGMGNSC